MSLFKKVSYSKALHIYGAVNLSSFLKKEKGKIPLTDCNFI